MSPVLDPGAARSALQKARLYAILDAAYAPPALWPDLARQLAAGGAGIFQIRAKNISKEEILTHARILAPILAQLGLPLILNDYPDLVAPSGAAGCHLGQDDLGIPEARRMLGSSVLLGLSTHSPCQALAGQAVGADHLRVPPRPLSDIARHEQPGGSAGIVGPWQACNIDREGLTARIQDLPLTRFGAALGRVEFVEPAGERRAQSRIQKTVEARTRERLEVRQPDECEQRRVRQHRHASLQDKHGVRQHIDQRPKHGSVSALLE
jgi:hypothetical protein